MSDTDAKRPNEAPGAEPERAPTDRRNADSRGAESSSILRTPSTRRDGAAQVVVLAAAWACGACAASGTAAVAEPAVPAVVAVPTSVPAEEASVCDGLSPSGKPLFSVPIFGDECVSDLSASVLTVACDRTQGKLYRRYDLRGKLLDEKQEPPAPSEAETTKAYQVVADQAAALGIDLSLGFFGVPYGDAGHVYLGADADANGVVVRVDAAGAVVWRHGLQADFADAQPRDAGVDSAGNVLVVGTARQEGVEPSAFLLSLNGAHGTTKWTSGPDLPGSMGIEVIVTAEQIAMTGLAPPEVKGEPPVLSFFARYTTSGQRRSLRIFDGTYALADAGGCILAANRFAWGDGAELKLRAFPY
jgi:hypothetical protein